MSTEWMEPEERDRTKVQAPPLPSQGLGQLHSWPRRKKAFSLAESECVLNGPQCHQPLDCQALYCMPGSLSSIQIAGVFQHSTFGQEMGA